jgi:hypothetical protein
MAMKQNLALIINVYAETWILVAIAFAVTRYWATCYPLAVGSFRVAQALGYLFCLHLYAAIFLEEKKAWGFTPRHTLTNA